MELRNLTESLKPGLSPNDVAPSGIALAANELKQRLDNSGDAIDRAFKPAGLSDYADAIQEALGGGGKEGKRGNFGNFCQNPAPL